VRKNSILVRVTLDDGRFQSIKKCAEYNEMTVSKLLNKLLIKFIDEKIKPEEKE
jgi:hypothetical protein